MKGQAHIAICWRRLSDIPRSVLIIGFFFLPCFFQAPVLQAQEVKGSDRDDQTWYSAQEQAGQLPIRIPEVDFHPLSTYADPQLEKALHSRLGINPAWRFLIEQKRMCVGIVDLSSPYRPRYAAVNGEHMMYAASLPKIAVLMAIQAAIEQGKIVETREIYSDMVSMIRSSSNRAASRLIDLVGFEYIEKTITSPPYKFYDVEKGGGLWVGKRYARSGETNREPLKNLSHAATVFQVCNFYYFLAYGKLISYERSEEMLQIMGPPDLRHKFVYTLSKVAPDAEVYRKSGTWKNWHTDSAIVWSDTRKYILVALIQDPSGEQIIRNLVTAVESIILR